MSHGLMDFDRMFSVREAPWHYDETGDKVIIPDQYLGREESMKLAGHDFSIIEQDVYRMRSFGLRTPLEGWKLLVNDITDEVLHVARDSYTVVQNETCWDIVDAIVNQPNVQYETGGTLRNGAVCWVLARLDEPYLVPGDDSYTLPFVCVTWTHDGTGAIQARSTEVRVVCWNTLSASEALARKGNTNFTFRHTKSVMSRIDEAKALLTGVRNDHSQFRELAEQLASMPVSDTGIKKFVHEFIPEPPADVVSERVRDNIDLARGMVFSLFDGDTIAPDIRNTAYGLLQAGTEYLDHLRGYRNHSTYLGRTLLREQPLKTKLVPLVRRIATADRAA